MGEVSVAAGMLIAQGVLYGNESGQGPLMRAVWSQMRIWAAGLLLLAGNSDATTWITAVFFPIAKLLSCLLTLLLPLQSSLFSQLLTLNLTMSLIYIFLVLCLPNYKPVLHFGLLCCPDLLLTVSMVLCNWQCPQDYWSRTIALGMHLQWMAVYIVPVVLMRNVGDYVIEVYGNHLKEALLAWCCPIASLCIWITMLHIANILFHPNAAVLRMVLGLVVWLLVYLHEKRWPYLDQKANKVAQNMLQTLWLWPLWLFWHNYYVLCILLLFSLRNIAK